MIQELQMKREDYEELLVHYFMQLLISIHRQILVKPRKKNLMLMDEMDRAVDYFREHYNEAISIEAYAADHNISVGWFYPELQTVYADNTGAVYPVSAHHECKIASETTNYNVSEISNLVGYENPLYFSRFFKKQCGMSPVQFRKQLLAADAKNSDTT